MHKILGRYALAAAIAAQFAVTAYADNVCESDKPVEVWDALQKAEAPTSSIILLTRRIPAGATTDIVLQRKFDLETNYRAIIKVGGGTPRPESVFLRQGIAVHAKPIPEDHALVKDGIVGKESTLLGVQVPAYVRGVWDVADLYVYGCSKRTKELAPALTFMGSRETTISSGLFSGIIVLLVVFVLYFLFAMAAWLAYRPKDGTAQGEANAIKRRWYRYLDPIFMTAGPTGRGSLSKLQVLFFSLIVFGLVTFIVLRTGVLSDLSPTVLALLGISGIATAASTATDVKQNRLDFDNWAWLVNKGWFPIGGLAAAATPRWRDLVTTSNEFDIYRFQSVIFSLVVGASLLVTGLTDLASFRVPETILGILGLSQVVYLSGKIVAPPSSKELDQKLSELQAAERAFLDRLTKDSAGKPATPPRTLDEAKQRAPDEYATYIKLAEKVRIMFTSTLGLAVDNSKVEPAYSWSRVTPAPQPNPPPADPQGGARHVDGEERQADG